MCIFNDNKNTYNPPIICSLPAAAAQLTIDRLEQTSVVGPSFSMSLRCPAFLKLNSLFVIRRVNYSQSQSICLIVSYHLMNCCCCCCTLAGVVLQHRLLIYAPHMQCSSTICCPVSMSTAAAQLYSAKRLAVWF